MLADKVKASSAKPVARRSRGRPKLGQAADIDKELCDVALQEFVRCGYSGTSMSSIVKIAGISKTTLYSRYPSKKELFLSVIRRMYDGAALREALLDDTRNVSLEEGLKAFARCSLQNSRSDIVKGLNRLVYSERYRFPELSEASIELITKIKATLTTLITQCAGNDGKTVGNITVPVGLYANMVQGFYVDAMLAQDELTDAQIEEWVEQAAHFVMSTSSDWTR